VSHKCLSIEGIFLNPEVNMVTVSAKDISSTGFMAFGYHAETYGYKEYAEIALEDIPYLIRLCEARGFELTDLREGYFSYMLPGVVYWAEVVSYKPNT
jgi:hypothetical protein